MRPCEAVPAFTRFPWYSSASFHEQGRDCDLAFSVNSIANPHVVLRRYQYLPCTRMDEDMSRIAQVAAGCLS
ncbi:protein of unknown function [Streptantibioticus cattleyicolor NRRL 8057 = DSM 46488]|nr:protein of unknown function [Streptantibioticus cattleyicolor NRRL 8057 = DSM 46488]